MAVRADIQAVSLVDAVCDSLRLSVINGDLAPGTALTEQRVAEDYGVARTTAKAAVERLVSAGFLQRSIHKTARVPVLTDDDITDLYESRIVLETDAVERLARSGAVPQDVEEAAEDVVRYAEAGNFDRMAASDVAFHSALVRAAGIERLARMHEALMGEAHLCMVQVQRSNPSDAATSHAEHSRVVAAIRAGDAATAAEEMRAHLERTRDHLLNDYRSAAS